MKQKHDFIVGPKDNAIEAVKMGNKEKAIEHIDEMWEGFKSLHDRYADWIQVLLDFIANKLGEEAVEEALRSITMEIYKDRFTLFKTMSAEEITRVFSQQSKGHYCDYYVEEDDEKFVIVNTYCGTGGRMQKEHRGGRTGKAYPWSYDQKGIPYYCCHESVFMRVFKELGIDNLKFEYGRLFDDQGKPTGDACRHIIYKGVARS